MVETTSSYLILAVILLLFQSGSCRLLSDGHQTSLTKERDSQRSDNSPISGGEYKKTNRDIQLISDSGFPRDPSDLRGLIDIQTVASYPRKKIQSRSACPFGKTGDVEAFKDDPTILVDIETEEIDKSNVSRKPENLQYPSDPFSEESKVSVSDQVGPENQLNGIDGKLGNIGPHPVSMVKHVPTNGHEIVGRVMDAIQLEPVIGSGEVLPIDSIHNESSGSDDPENIKNHGGGQEDNETPIGGLVSDWNLQEEQQSSNLELSLPSNLSSIYSASSDCSTSPKVFTRWATIEGFSIRVLGNCVDHFLGIPYAKPPVGDLRYAFPVPIKEKYRGEVFPARSFGPACKQSLASPITAQPSSEDCLYLNVYRPSNCGRNNLLPVMIIIHGGGYVSGAASQSFYYGGYFTSITDIIVVTFNYRLGAFGFLSGGGSKIPGNQGYFDCVLAAAWVKKYIKDFGGNPDQITLAGPSSGASLVTLCLFSKECSRLAHRFIITSPYFNAGTYFDSPQVTLRKSKSLSRQVGCGSFSTSEYYLSPAEIECLLRQDANIIAQQSISIIENDGNGICATNVLLPWYGNEIFPESIETMLYEKKFVQKVSILFGKVPTELTRGLSLTQGSTSKAQASLVLSKGILPLLRDGTSKNLAFILSYFLKNAKEGDPYSIGEAISTAVVDLCYHCQLGKLATAFAKSNRVFQYLYDYVPVPEIALPIHMYGAFHFDDTRIVFGMAFLFQALYTDYDREVTLELMRIYADFITGTEMKWSKWKVKQVKKSQEVYYPYMAVLKGRGEVNQVEFMEDVKICPRMDT